MPSSNVPLISVLLIYDFYMEFDRSSL